MRDDIAEEYREELEAERTEAPVVEPVVSLVNDGTLF